MVKIIHGVQYLYGGFLNMPELLLFFVAVQKQLQFMKYGDIIIQ